MGHCTQYLTTQCLTTWLYTGRGDSSLAKSRPGAPVILQMVIAWVLPAWISWVVRRRTPQHLNLLYLSVLFSQLFPSAHTSSFHVNHEVGLFTQEWNSLFTCTQAKGLTEATYLFWQWNCCVKRAGGENIRLSLPLTKLNENWREGTVPRALATLQRTDFSARHPHRVAHNHL